MRKLRLTIVGIIMCTIVLVQVAVLPKIKAFEPELDSIKPFKISSQNFVNTMLEDVEPFINQYCEEGYFIGENDQKLYYRTYKLPNPKATVVISHGFTESIEKYHEMIYYFLKSGCSVYMHEHRGHGRSGRLGKDSTQIYVENFDYYVKDLKTFIDTVVMKDATDKMFLFGHSMGGCISVRFLEEYPGYFDACVLNAPMLEVDTGKYSNWLAEIMADAAVFIKLGKEYCPGESPATNDHSMEGSDTSCVERYEYLYLKKKENPEIISGGASLKFLAESIDAAKKAIKPENAQKINIPVLLFQAELDTMVKPGGQNKFAQNAPNCKLIKMNGAKHGMFRERDEILSPYLDELFEFLNNVN